MSIIQKDKLTLNSGQEETGRRICAENQFMQLLMEAGENESVKTLLKEFCNSGVDTKTLFMYLMLYVHLEDYSSKKELLSPYQKIDIINNLIKNGETRKLIVSNTQRFLEN